MIVSQPKLERLRVEGNIGSQKLLALNLIPLFEVRKWTVLNNSGIERDRNSRCEKEIVRKKWRQSKRELQNPCDWGLGGERCGVLRCRGRLVVPRSGWGVNHRGNCSCAQPPRCGADACLYARRGVEGWVEGEREGVSDAA